MACYSMPPAPETATASRERRRVTLAVKVAVEEVTRLISTRFDTIEQKLNKVLENESLLSRINRLEVLLVASPVLGPSVGEVLSELLRRKPLQDDEVKDNCTSRERGIETVPEKNIEAAAERAHKLGLQVVEESQARMVHCSFDATVYYEPDLGLVAVMDESETKHIDIEGGVYPTPRDMVVRDDVSVENLLDKPRRCLRFNISDASTDVPEEDDPTGDTKKDEEERSDLDDGRLENERKDEKLDLRINTKHEKKVTFGINENSIPDEAKESKVFDNTAYLDDFAADFKRLLIEQQRS